MVTAFYKYSREEGGSKQRRGKNPFNLKHSIGRRTNRYRLSTNILRLKIRRLLASNVIRISSKGKKNNISLKTDFQAEFFQKLIKEISVIAGKLTSKLKGLFFLKTAV